MKCEWCGKEAWVKPAKLHEFRFCSRSCQGSWVSRNTHSPTKPENIVVEALTKLRLPFNREYRVGRYQCDFVLLGYKLVIEVDGDYWHSLPKQKISDKRKDTYLTNNGWHILRFRECDIYKDLSKCLARINKYIPLIQNR